MKQQALFHKKTNLIGKNSVILKSFSFLIRNFATSFARFLRSNIRKNFVGYCIKIKKKIMKHELIMSSLLILGNPMMANAQQTKTTTAKNISTNSIQAMRGALGVPADLQTSITDLYHSTFCPVRACGAYLQKFSSKEKL